MDEENLEHFTGWLNDATKTTDASDQRAFSVGLALMKFAREVHQTAVDPAIDMAEGWCKIAELFSDPQVRVLFK